jgi:hypothetical protein
MAGVVFFTVRALLAADRKLKPSQVIPVDG